MRLSLSIIIAATTSILSGAALAQSDAYYHTSAGEVPITRHPSLFVVGAHHPGVDLHAVAAALEQELRRTDPGAAAEPLAERADFARKGVSRMQVRATSFATLGRTLAWLRAHPALSFAEPVYLIGGRFPLYPQNQVTVRLAREVGPTDAAALHARMGGRLVRTWEEDRQLQWVEPTVADGSVALANRYAVQPEVVFAEPDFLVPRSPRYVPNDPRYPDEWHLWGGDASIHADAPVDIEPAWDMAYDAFPFVPDDTLVVGVCDTGVLEIHEDLRTEGPGYDVTNSDAGINPDDGADGHGTNVAGVAAAIGDNDAGVAGACPTCGVVAIKLDLPGVVPDSDLLYAFAWASQYDMPALNNSWGLDTAWLYVPMSNTMKEAIDWFSTEARDGKGGVIVFASGNSNQLAALDGSTGYNRTLTVGASTCQSLRASYSNFGHAVDVIAPSNGNGCGISTTRIVDDLTVGDRYMNNFGGTSSAAPLVTGIIGLMTAANPDLTEAQIREAVILSADLIDEENAAYYDSPFFDDPAVQFSWTHAHGRVNALRAVELALAYGDSGCTQEYEICNGEDDDCDGSTADEMDACNPCQLDVSTNGREYCDDGVDNDCDGLTDPDDCIVPCEDLGGVCHACESGADCWMGLECSFISPQMDGTYCLQRCVTSATCPEGFFCETWITSTCIPQGFSCEGLESELPDESCAEGPEPDAGLDAGEEDTDADGGPPVDSGDASDSGKSSGCGCSTTGRAAPSSLVALVLGLLAS